MFCVFSFYPPSSFLSVLAIASKHCSQGGEVDFEVLVLSASFFSFLFFLWLFLAFASCSMLKWIFLNEVMFACCVYDETKHSHLSFFSLIRSCCFYERSYNVANSNSHSLSSPCFVSVRALRPMFVYKTVNKMSQIKHSSDTYL